MAMNEFDFVIVGAGSAGCVLANRLSQNGKYTVAIIEAGGKDNWVWFHIPVGYLYAINNPRADWCYKTESEVGLNGRSLSYPRGKVIGGSSAINAMIYMRGQAADYNSWGLQGWDYQSLLPHFEKPLNHFQSGHNNKEWRVEAVRMTWKILDDFRTAAITHGIPATDSFNNGDNEGVGYFHVNQKKGVRWSTARGYLKPVLGRENLTLFTNTHADKVILEGKRAVGILTDKGIFKVRKEVILSAGAVATPALLERSGIGNSSILKDIGIECQHELKGVGENLQDHLQLRLIFKVKNTKTMNELSQSLIRKAWWGLQYIFARRGPLTLAPSQLGAFTKSSSQQARANVQFHIQPLSLEKFGDPLHEFNALTVSVCNLRPTSRGSVHARSKDLYDKPVIAPHYLTTKEDKQVAIESIRLARDIMKHLPQYEPEEYLPNASYQSDRELETAAGMIGTTIFHPVGTCKMGDPSDEMAVVDKELKVIGLEGLRVIDASIMPTITSGNTNSPTVMIAEKGAEMILQKT